jgi:hypothetical protein
MRIGTCLFGFYFIADGNWQPLVISLIGFMIARPAIKLLIDLRCNHDQTKGRVKDAT